VVKRAVEIEKSRLFHNERQIAQVALNLANITIPGTFSFQFQFSTFSFTKELLTNKLRKIAAGFLPSGGAGKPQECLLPFKVLSCRMAVKRQGKMCKLFVSSS